MAFTAEGNGIAADGLAEQLVGATIVVTDGSQEAEAPLSQGYPIPDGAIVRLKATFGESAANFEWRARRVKNAGGLVVDQETVDMGRKAAGAVWDLEIELELGG